MYTMSKLRKQALIRIVICVIMLAPPLDLWHEAKHHKKQTGALLLYNLRLQRLYELWANRPKNRRRKLP